jgi:transposase
MDKLQRCWAHLLREVDNFIDISENGKRLSDDIHLCLKTLRDFLDRDPSIEERIEKKAVFKTELEAFTVDYANAGISQALKNG